jgi:hypothetical protein
MPVPEPYWPVQNHSPKIFSMKGECSEEVYRAAWVFAAVALHYADKFIEDYQSAWTNAEKLFTEIRKNERFKIEMFEGGSHIVKLTVANTNLEKFKESLGRKNVTLNNPVNGGFMLKVNPSINNDTVQDVAGYFLEALKEASV